MELTVERGLVIPARSGVTTRILTEASITGRVDHVRGLKRRRSSRLGSTGNG